MATVKEFTRLDLPPQTHAYDDPDLSPIEFLQAVYRDRTLPMSTRIDAARALLPYTEPRPANSFPARCKIIIGGLGPCDPSSGPPEQPEQTNEKSQSFSSIANNNLQPQSETPGPSILRDYSIPPTPADLLSIKAAINNLRPDLAHLPIPEPRLCACGHWVSSPCPLGEQCREKSKLN
jgi:hypothetical protein